MVKEHRVRKQMVKNRLVRTRLSGRFRIGRHLWCASTGRPRRQCCCAAWHIWSASTGFNGSTGSVGFAGTIMVVTGPCFFLPNTNVVNGSTPVAASTLYASTAVPGSTD